MRHIHGQCAVGASGWAGSAAELFAKGFPWLRCGQLGAFLGAAGRHGPSCPGRSPTWRSLGPGRTARRATGAPREFVQAGPHWPFLDIPGTLKRLFSFGARFGLSDPRARRSTVTPLVMTQASARPPQSCGG